MENCNACISGLFGNLACVDCPKVEQEYRQSPLDWLEGKIDMPEQPENDCECQALHEKVELLEREITFLAKTIGACPVSKGFWKSCKGECHQGGTIDMVSCWRGIAQKELGAN